MTLLAEVPRGTAALCIRDHAGCATHRASWPAAEPVCWAVTATGPDTPAAWVETRIASIPIDLVDVGPNVRVNVEGIDELAASIVAHGVLQPIKVRHDGDRWTAVWGQRRLLAARQAGLARIPAIVTEDAKASADLSIEQLIENLHRADLNPIDRARAMRDVVEAGRSQADLARELGVHPSTVSNDIRLLGLDASVQKLVEDGAISPSHAKSIAALPLKQQHDLAQRAVSAKLSSHDLEREIKWKQESAQQEANKVAKTGRVTPKVLAALDKAAPPKTAQLFVTGPSYDIDVAAIVRAIKAAGWKQAVHEYSYGGRPEGCTCTAVRVEVSGRGAGVIPTCTNKSHQVDGRDAEEQARRAAEKERQRLSAELQAVVRRDLDLARSRSRHNILALISWALESWHNETWDVHVAHSDDELLDDISRAITVHHRIRDIDLGALLEAMASDQGRTTEAKATRSKRAEAKA